MRATAKSTTRKATAITLAAALAVAVYLNWQYSRTGVSLNEDAVNVSAAVVETEAEAVAASPITDGLMTEAEAVSSANKNYGEAQLVSVANDSGSKFLKKPASSGKKPTMLHWIPSRKRSKAPTSPPRKRNPTRGS